MNLGIEPKHILVLFLYVIGFGAMAAAFFDLLDPYLWGWGRQAGIAIAVVCIVGTKWVKKLPI